MTPDKQHNEVQRPPQKNHKDIKALLRAAVKQQDSETKRRILNRILLLDPQNTSARDMLLELDQAELRKVRSLGRTNFDGTVSPEPLEGLGETSLMLTYPLVLRAIVLGLMVLLAAACLATLDRPWLSLVCGILCLLLAVPLWIVSTVVDVSRAGLRSARLFGIVRQEITWAQIAAVKPARQGPGLTLHTSQGAPMAVSARMQGYPALVALLQSMRPDLFRIAVDDVNSLSGADLL